MLSTDKLSDAGSSGPEAHPQEAPPLVITDQSQLINTHPQQTEHTFDGIKISSKFDSGNLASVRWNPEEPTRFDLYLSGDGLPYTKRGHYFSWFYFSVTGAK